MTTEALAAGGVRLEVDGALATVVLDRPERRNAMTPSTWAALAAVPGLLPAGIRVVLIRGEGPAFSAGLDLRLASADGVPGEGSLADAFDPGDDASIQARVAVWQQAFTWLRDPAFITVAAVQGPAVGAGFQLALSADLRLLADDARLCMRENALGLIPDLTGTKALVDAVGYSRALEICATARWIDAEEALRLGLANAVVPASGLDAAAGELVAALLANSPEAGVAVKALLLGAADRELEAQAAAERAAQAPLLRAMVARIR